MNPVFNSNIRVFWLGMHKVLKRTELRYLRDLGLEVFNPPYISPVYDQSADRHIDYDQPTTLPKNVFDTLIRHDFFYTNVPLDVAELLNTYFDTIIVTINLDWLRSILAVYRGKVVFRLYGQHFPMSAEIVGRGHKAWEDIVTRDDFTIVPFSQESVEKEQDWFLDLCSDIVPYQIPDDVFDLSNTWSNRRHKREIATSIPNIENPYYRSAYDDFNRLYPNQVFRIYGPQRAIPADNRIVGALERADFLDSLATSSGFLYNYRDAVCYLSPIEMMEIGGPVLYAPGSLLSRFYDAKTPGLVDDLAQARRKLRLLLSGDMYLIAEIIAAQETVRARYDRATVRPVFDRVFTKLLDSKRASASLLRVDGYGLAYGRSIQPSRTSSPVYILVFLHVDGLFGYSKGRAYAFEGIPRVIDVLIDTMIETSNISFIITCTLESRAVVYDFYRAHIQAGRVELRVIDLHGHPESFHAKHERIWLIEDMNRRDDVVGSLVPHYYLFPEALLLSKPVVLYLPDYFPHLMPDAVFDTSVEKDRENKEVGVATARKAAFILTNSEFTKNYLSAAGFALPTESNKIIVAPLPLLGGRRAVQLTTEEEQSLKNQLGGRRFIFYPTANRPNKQIAFLLRLFAVMRLIHPDLIMVLTCDLGSVPGVAAVADEYGVRSHLVFMSRVGDDVLAWLYRNAAALCLTSTLEGNFPPQVLEALAYDTPVVATRLPTITEALGDYSSQLLLCDPLNLDEFRLNLETALSQRSDVLSRQSSVLLFLQESRGVDRFAGILHQVLLGESTAKISAAA